jgi:pyridoxal phosphate enzyme (YggS family)
MSLIDNYKLIRDKINALSAGITLVAVSKTFSLNHIKPLIDFGHLHYGENKVQEATQKWTDLIALRKDLKLHMVGNVQSNKAEEVVQIFSYVHSLDSEKLANKFSTIQSKFNKQLKYFIQVNVGSESQKKGIEISLVPQFVNYCQKELKLNILGLMCIPPISPSPDVFFSKLRDLNDIFNFKNISMGMSSDFETAIKYGANYVRIGSSLFGERAKQF